PAASCAASPAHEDFPEDCPPVTSTSRPTSEVDAAPRLDPAVVGVLDLHHLGDGVGQVDQRLWTVAARDDHVGLRRAVPDRGGHLLDVQPAPVHRIGQLVEYQQVDLSGGERDACRLPRVPGERLGLVEVLGQPGEPVTAGAPFDTEFGQDLVLACSPVPGLDELDRDGAPAPRQRSDRHAERGGGLALAVAGVDQHDGVDVDTFDLAVLRGNHGRVVFGGAHRDSYQLVAGDKLEQKVGVEVRDHGGRQLVEDVVERRRWRDTQQTADHVGVLEQA